MDLRKHPPPAPASNAIPEPPASGMPFVPGQVILTDYTRKQLTTLGWKEGDPIPGDMGEKIARLQKKIKADSKTAVPDLPDDFKPNIPSLVNIEDLPEEAQAELRESLDLAGKQYAVMEARRKQKEGIDAQMIDPENAGAGVNEAIRVAAQAAQEYSPLGQGDTGVDIIDDRGQEAPQRKPLPRRPETPPPPEKSAPAAPTGPEPEKPETPEPPPLPAPSWGGGADTPDKCPRCEWDLRLAFVTEPTERDKEAWIAATLAIPPKRFYKTVELLGGKLRLTFRDLTAVEASLVFQQLGYESRAGRFDGQGEWYMAMQDYRLCLGLDSILLGSQSLIKVPPPEEVQYDGIGEGGPPTPLPVIKEYVYAQVLASESLKRIVGQQHRLFQRLVEKLEAMIAEPDFWPGIE